MPRPVTPARPPSPTATATARHRQQPTPNSRPPPPKASPRPRPDAPQPIPGHSRTTRRRHHAQELGHNPHRRRSHAKGPGAHAPRPIFCTNHQPQPAQADATSRRKTPALRLLRSRDKSTAPFLRPSQPHLCALCVIPRHHLQSLFLPFYHLPDTALLYPPRSYPDPRFPGEQ